VLGLIVTGVNCSTSSSSVAGSEQLSNCLTFRRWSPILKHVPNQHSELDRLFRALADGTRRAMIERLVEGPRSVGELARPLAMSLPAVMQHLQALQECGLVRSEKVGRTRSCRIEPDGLRMAESWLAGQRTAWERHLDRLGDFLAEPPTSAEREP